MVFLEKEQDGIKIWELQIETKILCSEEERRIYGVEYKMNPEARNPFVAEQEFADTGKYYVARGRNYWPLYSNPFFKDLEKAKEFLIERYKEKCQLCEKNSSEAHMCNK